MKLPQETLQQIVNMIINVIYMIINLFLKKDNELKLRQ